MISEDPQDRGGLRRRKANNVNGGSLHARVETEGSEGSLSRRPI